ncbi:HNH endonuclease [Pseudomonas fluorescens]|nr:HNH endonuclease [Pseudomonas fluorescens]
MAFFPVEWVLVIYYGSSAHRATYGRLGGSLYTKDYIQLSRKSDFLTALSAIFPPPHKGAGSVPLTYKWATGSTKGALVFLSADRPHLKWETILGAPKVWKMSMTPSDAGAETIIGDPSHENAVDADRELTLLRTRGAGQPYLIAVKLVGEPNTLHLRAYLDGPGDPFSWASLNLAPTEIRALAAKTSQKSALAWSAFESSGLAPTVELQAAMGQLLAAENYSSVVDGLDLNIVESLAAYLQAPGSGLFFDPDRNHDAWTVPGKIDDKLFATAENLLSLLDARLPRAQQGDAAAEELEISQEELEEFRSKIADKSFEVEDSRSTVKTRGSAQRAFAEAVKTNYGYKCAVTGIENKDFLIASHIVPWSEDQTIRLDPTNGICLSLIVDRAFEKGYLLVGDDLTLDVDEEKIGGDAVLKDYLLSFKNNRLMAPKDSAPKIEYLQRRRSLVLGT